MKTVVHFSRILIGLLFILSGLLKLNDPLGFSYKLEEYFAVFAGDVEAQQDTLTTTISLNGNSESIKTVLHRSDSLINVVVLCSGPSAQDSLVQTTITALIKGQEVFSSTQSYSDTSYKTIPVELAIQHMVGRDDDSRSTQTLSVTPSSTFSADFDASSYIIPDSWLVGFFHWLEGYALFLAILMSWLEAILGFALLIGWKHKFTLWMLILLTLFFGFLTLYSWVYDKVTDCGCFGDALPMNPEESFYKNVVIGIFLLVLYFGKKYISPIFSTSFGVKFLTILSLMLVGFSLYCKHYLPVVDFLHYAEGTDIRDGMKVPPGERASDHVQTVYRYVAKDGSGSSIDVTYDSDKNTFDPKIDYSKWSYDAVVSETILEEAYEPPIHDFAFYDETQSNNYIDDFWNSSEKLLIVMHDVSKANGHALPELNELAREWKSENKPVWVLTANTPEEVERFRHQYQLDAFEFYYGDNTNLKSIIRSNPGLVLIKDTSVVAKVWPSTRLPKYKHIQKALK